MTSLRKIITLLYLSFVLYLAMTPSSWARSDGQIEPEEYQSKYFPWPHRVFGLELGVKALGKFGKDVSVYAPAGDFLFQLSPHIWFEHLIEFHGTLGMGLSRGTFEIGLGGKFNLLEVLGKAEDLREKGLTRGLLSKFIQNYMIYVGLDLVHYSFRDSGGTDGAPAPENTWAFQGGAGIQWYLGRNKKILGLKARDFYLDLSLSVGRIDSVFYLLPSVRLGIDF